MAKKKRADFKVRASRDGHEFHEAWAGRKALQLLLPLDGFAGMAVESLSPEDQGKAADASVEVADLVLYYGRGTSLEVADQVAVLQYKYSIGREVVPFRHAR